MTTADWNGTEPIARSTTRRHADGSMWGCRKVRADGTVRFAGHTFRPAPDVQTIPEPGEWLLFANYDAKYESERGPTCLEWTAPGDPDTYIRRAYWQAVA